jgi:hypothetical protein
MRFSLRGLLILVGGLSVYCALVFTAPVVLSILGLTMMSLFVPPVIVGGIIYGRGAWRAFWIGCAASGFIPFFVAAYLGLSMSAMILTGDDELDDAGRWYGVGLAFCHALVFFNGIIVVAMRWVYGDGRADRPATSDSAPYTVIHRRITLDRSVDS